MKKALHHNPRYNVVSARISKEERIRLDDIATKNNMKISDIMRIALKHYTLKYH